MGANNARLESYLVETGDPGWNIVDDMFAWFDDRKDEKWIVMSEQARLTYWPERRLMRVYGMPMNLPLVEVIASGWGRGKKFKDYIYAYLGVRADKRWPDYGKTIVHHRYIPQEGEPMIVHVWGIILLARPVETLLKMLWNVGEIRGNIASPSYQAALQNMPKPRWSTQLLDASLSRPNDLITLAKGFELVSRNFRIKMKRGGPNRRRDYLKTDEELKDFTRKVNEFRPVWGRIKKWFVEQDYDGGSVRAIQTLKWFQELSAQCGGIPESVLKLVMSRKEVTGRKNWPYAFALEHARVTFKIKPLEFDRLDEVYKAGKKLLGS